MSDFPIHTVDSAPETSRPILRALAQQVGFVPNLAATMATSPTLLESFTSVRSTLGGGSLKGPERETIALVVSQENRCTYCMAAHSAFATMVGTPKDDIEALRRGESPTDPRLRAAANFARRVVRARGVVQGSDLESFLDAGFNRAQALEVVAVIGMTSLANWTHSVTDVVLDDDFETHRWEQ